MATSYVSYGSVPSAILSDGVITVPLWAVTSIALSETFHLPAIGSAGARAVVATHDDTITLAAVLPGPERHTLKLALESLADVSRRGSALAALSGGRIGGLALVTAMTVRTDMHVQSLSFTASAAKRDALDVSISLVHMPLPGSLPKLLDVASLGVGSLADWAGR